MNPDEQCRLDAVMTGLRESFDDLVFWSFRYFLGRQTIQACSFADGLARVWPRLDERIKELIKRELEDEFRRDDAARERNSDYRPLGADCDREAWEKVRAWWVDKKRLMKEKENNEKDKA